MFGTSEAGTRVGTIPGALRAMALAVGLVAAACSGNPGGPTAAPATAATATAGIRPSAAGAALVGAWTTAVTKDDFQAAGLTDPGLQNENSGRFTFTFGADGTWTQIQQSLDGSPINSPVFRGTYTVDGSSLVVTTQFPTEYADGGLHYSWAIAGSDLTLDLLDPPDEVLPVVIESHPWTPTGG